MPIPSTGGRPLTADGHRDNAMLSMLEFRGELDAFVRLLQQHYREERDAITTMVGHVHRAALSWQYGEIVEQHAAQQVAQAMRQGAS